MPHGIVKTERDEALWSEAKKMAKKRGHKNNYAYIMGIYKQMSGMKKSIKIFSIDRSLFMLNLDEMK